MPDKITKIDAIFAEFDRPDSPGAALGVVHHGQLVYSRGYGSANLDYNLPITPDTIFDIGSVSKQFTAAAIALLAQRGKLSLDDPIQAHLPEIRHYTHPITIRHLIHHTSGLKDYLELMAYAGMPFDNDYQEAQVVDLIARQKSLNFEPGSQYLYSNSGYFLLSEIVERASGKNLHEFAREALFEPLGMMNTQFRNNYKEIIKHRATGYSRLPDGNFEIDNGLFDVTGDGAVFTSVNDLFLWDQNSYHNALEGGQALIEMLRQPGKFNDGKLQDYAFGLRISDYRGLPVVRHSGSWYGFRADLVQFPQQQFSVICLTNMAQMTPSLYTDRIADIWLEGEFAAPLPQRSSQATLGIAGADHSDKAGLYYSEAQKAAVRLAFDDNRLAMLLGGKRFELLQTSDDSFIEADGPVPLEMRFTPLSTPGKWSNRVKIEALDWDDEFILVQERLADASTLGEYAGSFESDELLTRYAVEVADGQLKISSNLLPIATVRFIRQDHFYGDGLTVQFTRGSNGEINGLSVSTGRVKEVHFIKTEAKHSRL